MPMILYQTFPVIQRARKVRKKRKKPGALRFFPYRNACYINEQAVLFFQCDQIPIARISSACCFLVFCDKQECFRVISSASVTEGLDSCKSFLAENGLIYKENKYMFWSRTYSLFFHGDFIRNSIRGMEGGDLSSSFIGRSNVNQCMLGFPVRVQSAKYFLHLFLQNGVPGPGTYGKGGIPSAFIEENLTKSASNVGLLDSGMSYKRQLPEVGSHLCPGQYEMKSFTDELEARVISKRGPYDLFTGERNKPITVGYFALPAKQNLGPGEYDLKSFLHDLQDEHRKHHGAFLKVQRFPPYPTNRIYCSTLSQYPRSPNDPGPGTYTSQELSKPQAAIRPPFGSTAERFDRHARRFFLGSTNPVGPGRYDVDRHTKAHHVNGNSSAFKSGTKRYDLIRDKYLTERIKSREVDKVFMVPIDAQ